MEQNSSIIFEFNEAIYNIYELSGIVIWGSNLGSSLNSKKLRKAIREMFVLPHHYVGILVGLLLSDAGINKSLSNRLMRIAFVQSFTVHFYYFMHIYFSLQFIFRCGAIAAPVDSTQFKNSIEKREKKCIFIYYKYGTTCNS